ncbi:hypothetical protein, partial [Helicobacter sp. T3_23-1059]
MDKNTCKITKIYIWRASKEHIIKEIDNAKNGGSENEVSVSEVTAGRGTPHPLSESIAKNNPNLHQSEQKLLKEVNVSELNDEQRGIYEVFSGQKDKIILQGKDLNDLYTL